MISQRTWLTVLTAAVFVALTTLSAGSASAGKLDKLNARMAVIQKQADRAKDQVAKDTALRRLQGIQNRIAKLQKQQTKERSRRLVRSDRISVEDNAIIVGHSVESFVEIPPAARNLVSWGWPVNIVNISSIYPWAAGRRFGVTNEALIVDLDNVNGGAARNRYFASGMSPPTAAQIALLRKISDAVSENYPIFMSRFPICASGQIDCSFGRQGSVSPR